MPNLPFAPEPRQDIMISTLSQTGSILDKTTEKFILVLICLDLSPEVLYANGGFILIHLLSTPSDDIWILDLFNVVKTLFFSKHFYHTVFGFLQLILNTAKFIVEWE